MFNPNLKSEWFTSVMQVINNITMLSIILYRRRAHSRARAWNDRASPGDAGDAERDHAVEDLGERTRDPRCGDLSMKLVVQLWLQVPIAGSLLLFLAGALVYAFSVTSMGILLATYTTSMGQFGLLVIPVL